jgi:hypothetical protein
MEFSVRHWCRISLFNLLVLSLIGVTLRYKIAYYFPYIDQKHLLHGHSHFAFAGWVSMALMVLMVHYLEKKGQAGSFKKYKSLLWANLLTAVGMLIAFPIEGYGIYSIIFSTASIFVSYVFAIVYWRDLNRLPVRSVSHQWFKASLVFSIFSSLGAFALAVMMINRINHQDWYLASEYFYLHFQYNGWFFFACMGLAADKQEMFGAAPHKLTLVYRLFVWSAIPAYLLSTLWMNLPLWLYLVTITAVILQLAGWFAIFQIIRKQVLPKRQRIIKPARIILTLSFLALTIKFLLQSGSVIPSLSTLAFGFRPIVIGYLHLVLLGFTTLFLLGSMLEDQLIPESRTMAIGLAILAFGIILNEAFLMLQGITGLYYQAIPDINEWLLMLSIMIFSGLLIINIASRKMK